MTERVASKSFRMDGDRAQALFGFNRRGEEVYVPLNHTGLSGINDSGKTEAAKALARRFAEAGVKLFIMDVKTIQKDYAGFGDAEVPVYIERSTAPETIQLLLEQTEDRSFDREFHRILRAYKSLREDERSVANILKVMERWVEDYRLWEERYAAKKAKWIERPFHPLDHKADNTIAYFLEKLVKQLALIKPSGTFALPGTVNVMDLTKLDRDYQQLPVESVLAYIEKHRTELAPGYLLVVTDEFTRFAPQAGKAAAKQRFIYAIKEFRAGRTYFMVIDQTLSGVQIQARKQIWNWIMGKQTDTAESERVMKEIPADLRNVPGTPVTPDQVKKLEKGWFVVWTAKGVDVAYAAPYWAPLEEARKVALGQTTPEELADRYQPDIHGVEEPVSAPAESDTFPRDFDERVKAVEAALDRMGV